MDLSYRNKQDWSMKTPIKTMETQILEDRVPLYNIQTPTGSQSHINWSTELNLQQKLRQLEYNNNSALSH